MTRPLTHAPAWLRPIMADAAQYEVERRERLWPDKVKAGQLTAEEADADYAAWVAIRALLAGERPNWPFTWDDLADTADRAVTAAEARLDKAPDDERRVLLLRALEHIALRLAWIRDGLADLNRRLREHAERKAA